jgi:sec-independent protein translocase protein TatA
MGPVGVQEMFVIFLVALLLFGPKKLPELGKSIGKAISEFRRAQSELKATFESHMRELEKENESIKEVTRSYTNEIYNSYNGYESSSLSDAITYHGEEPPSIEAHPSTVSVPAIEGAESSVSPNEAPSGTVPRTMNGQNHAPAHDMAQPAAGQSTVHEPAEPESINT